MASTQIVSCKCKNEFQDKKYGQGKRVHNLAKGKDDKIRAKRCTVCGDKKD